MSNPRNNQQRLSQAALPNPEYCPTGLAEFAAYSSISRSVRLDSLAPERAVRLGHSVATGTSVPKATVYKQGHVTLAENKIRSSRQVRVPSPTCNFVVAQKANHAQFRSSISDWTDSSHDLRALLSRENVGHATSFTDFSRVRREFLLELNWKRFAQVELHHYRHRDGLRPGSIADSTSLALFFMLRE